MLANTNMHKFKDTNPVIVEAQRVRLVQEVVWNTSFEMFRQKKASQIALVSEACEELLI
jgi:hypothetical protein